MNCHYPSGLKCEKNTEDIYSFSITHNWKSTKSYHLKWKKNLFNLWVNCVRLSHPPGHSCTATHIIRASFYEQVPVRSCPRRPQAPAVLEHSPVKGKIIHEREASSCDRGFLPVTGNFFLWQNIFSCDRKFLPVTGNFFLRLRVQGQDSWHLGR